MRVQSALNTIAGYVVAQEHELALQELNKLKGEITDYPEDLKRKVDAYGLATFPGKYQPILGGSI